MKQLLIIIVIFLAVSVVTSLYFQVSRNGSLPEDIVLTVNGKHFTVQEVDTYFSGCLSQLPPTDDGHHGDRLAMLKAFAEERVLIQEAQRLAIDQQQDFRDKIQRYYEFSLISALRNHQEQLFRQEIAADNASIEQLISHFLDLYGRDITFRMSADNEQTTLPFSMIPNLYKPVLADMQPGETRQVILTGNTPSEVTLIAISEKTEAGYTPPDRDNIREQLIDYRTGVKLNAWNMKLNSNASITYAKEH